MHLSVEQIPARDSAPSVGGLRRRVLISGGMASGGPQTHVPLLCAVLREAGAEVTIAAASTDWDKRALDEVRRLGVRVIVSPFRFGRLQAFGKVWSFLTWPLFLRRDHDVLCCIGEGRMHFWARRFLRPGAFKIYYELVQSPLPESVAAQVAAEMDGLLATCTSVARGMEWIKPGISARGLPSLTSAVSVPEPKPRPPRREGETLRIAYLGRVVPLKRPLELVNAFADWSRRAPFAPARLDIYGGDVGGETRRIQARIAELGLEKSVSLRGSYWKTDLDRILGETDLVVLPSTYEGQPIVLIEAMQRGVPIVATSAGGTAELGIDNPDVIISPGTDWSTFATAAETMAVRLRAGQVDSPRLHAWTEARYGYQAVANAWREALLSPETFFAPKKAGEDRT